MLRLLLSLIFIIDCTNVGTNKGEVLHDIDADYYGEWKIKGIYFNRWMISGENYLNEEEVKAYDNSLVILEENKITLFGTDCVGVEYSEEQQNAFDHFYSEYKLVADTINGSGTRGMSVKELGIESDTVQVVEILCKSQYYRFYPINEKKAIIENRRVFFHLERQ